MTLAERLHDRLAWVAYHSQLLNALLNQMPEHLEQRLFDRFFATRGFHWSYLQWPLLDTLDRAP